jgi:small subunit ribosomal protein S17
MAKAEAKSMKTAAPVQTENEARGTRKFRQGLVVSDKMQKTVVVQTVRRTQHGLYGKTVLKSEKFKAHVDEQDVDGVSTKMVDDQKLEAGDTVEIMETRPLSREKCWRVVRILEKVK